MEKIFVISWSIWLQRNNVISNLDAQLEHVSNLAVKLFDDMRYYNIMSRILGKNDIISKQIMSKRLVDQ